MKYQPYSEYKNTEVIWFDKAPKYWGVKKIKLSASVLNRYAFDSKTYTNEGIPIIRIGDVGQDIDWEAVKKVPEGLLPKLVRFKVERGDILLALTGATIGKSSIFSEDRLALLNQRVGILRKQDINQSFLGYVVSSEIFTKPIDLLCYGGAQENIGKDEIGGITICSPSSDEQEKIASFLDYKTQQIDQLIEKKKALIEKLNEQRIAVITQAVTKGLDKNAKMKPSGVDWLGAVPAHWDKKKLKFVAHLVGGGTPNTNVKEYWDGDIPWVSPKDMKNEVIKATQDYITDIGLKESATNLVEQSEVLIVVRSGILKHSIPVAINTVPVSLNQDMKAIVVDRSQLLPEYLKYLIWSNQYSLLPLWSKPGCTVESIETEYMMNTKLLLPPLAEQEDILLAIEGSCKPIDTMLKACATAVDLYTEYRRKLRTDAVT